MNVICHYGIMAVFKFLVLNKNTKVNVPTRLDTILTPANFL